MPQRPNTLNSTLKELSRIADMLPDETPEDCSRPTVDWARTFLGQVSVLAGLAGIRLPQPFVKDGVWLVWNLDEVHLRVRLWRTPCSSAESKQTNSPLPFRLSNFTIAGEISSAVSTPNEQRDIFASFEIYGRFSPEFLFSSLFDWFTTNVCDDHTLDGSAGSKPAHSTGECLEPAKPLGVWIATDETRDIHEAVREAFAAFQREGRSMKFVGLTLEQMDRLRGDWDGRGSPPPSAETVEWARTVLKNLDEAADAAGIGFSQPLTLIRSIETAPDSPPEVSLAVGCYLGTNLLDIDVSVGPRDYIASVALDFSPELDEESGKQWLVAEFSVLREHDKSPADTLRSVLW